MSRPPLDDFHRDPNFLAYYELIASGKKVNKSAAARALGLKVGTFVRRVELHESYLKWKAEEESRERERARAKRIREHRICRRKGTCIYGRRLGGTGSWYCDINCLIGRSKELDEEGRCLDYRRKREYKL